MSQDNICKDLQVYWISAKGYRRDQKPMWLKNLEVMTHKPGVVGEAARKALYELEVKKNYNATG